MRALSSFALKIPTVRHYNAGGAPGEREEGRRERERVRAAAVAADAVAVSARTGEGLDALVEAIQGILVSRNLTPVELLVPYDQGAVLGEMRKVGVVDEEEFREDGTRVAAHVPVSLARRYAHLALDRVNNKPAAS